LSKNNLKKLARALVPELKPSEMRTLPGSSNDLLKPFEALPASVATEVHREKQEGIGNELDPLIAWYSLVAKPIPRKLWASMPKAQAAIDAEWAKLRACDDGKGTWDESTVCS
jgi:hypothetical protein